MYCVRCGAKLPEGAGYCNQCGARVGMGERNKSELERLQLDNAMMENGSRKVWGIIGGSFFTFWGGALIFGPIGGLVALGVMWIVALFVAAYNKKK